MNARKPEVDPLHNGWSSTHASPRGTLAKRIEYHERVLRDLREQLERMTQRHREPDEWLGESVYELLPNHVELATVLEESGIFTVRQLLECRKTRLLSISGIGEQRLRVIFACLRKAGFQA